jgi:hypothetical protein
LIPTQCQELIFPPTARPKIPAQDYIPSQPGLGIGTL